MEQVNKVVAHINSIVEDLSKQAEIEQEAESNTETFPCCKCGNRAVMTSFCAYYESYDCECGHSFTIR